MTLSKLKYDLSIYGILICAIVGGIAGIALYWICVARDELCNAWDRWRNKGVR